MNTAPSIVTTALLVAGLCQPAFASDDSPRDKPQAKKRKRPSMEMSFTFLAGQRSYARSDFSFDRGSGNQVLFGPFRSPALSGIAMTGYGFRLRYIDAGYRFGIGWDRPYAELADGPVVVALGEGQSAQVRAIESRELRLSVGVQRGVGRLVGFIDLVGNADQLTADVVSGEDQATYKSRNFSFALAAGVTHLLSESLYGHVSGELGLRGVVDWNVNAGLGLRL